MKRSINIIIKDLVKELTVTITHDVTENLRTSIADDVKSLVKEVLNKNQLEGTNPEGWLTIAALSEKYKISRRAINYKCTLFNIPRKRVGRHNLVNELEFLKAHDRPMERPSFLKRQTAA